MSTHRQMVIISPCKGMSMTRNQMETHLTLHGWQPMYVGQGAAVDEYELVVYTFDKIGPGRAFDSKVETAWQTLTQLNLKNSKWGYTKQMCDGCWYMSDKYFWPLAHACVEATNQRK